MKLFFLTNSDNICEVRSMVGRPAKKAMEKRIVA